MLSEKILYKYVLSKIFSIRNFVIQIISTRKCLGNDFRISERTLKSILLVVIWVTIKLFSALHLLHRLILWTRFIVYFYYYFLGSFSVLFLPSFSIFILPHPWNHFSRKNSTESLISFSLKGRCVFWRENCINSDLRTL